MAATSPSKPAEAGSQPNDTASGDAVEPIAGERGQVAVANQPQRPVPAPGEPGWLPEVKLENVGFHIGGGPNDAQTAAPFKRALEREYGRFLRCYREIADPGQDGTFGVDLFIPRQGGNPEVRQPRTGMSGANFKNCMIEAFSNVRFERPSLGPTILSYSVRFSIEDPSANKPP